MDKHVVIVGAGPAGLLLAGYLFRRSGYRITLYEQRSDPRLTSPAQNRTFPISLQKRGRLALREMPGLEEAIATQSTICTGTIMHRASGKNKVIPRNNPSLMLDRNRLVVVLLQYLASHYDPDQMMVQFNHQCLDLNPLTQTLKFENASGKTITTPYDYVVGADGASSRIRAALADQVGFPCEQTYLPDAYKSVFLNQPEVGLKLATDKVHTWNLANNLRMMLVPQGDEQLNGVIIFNSDQNPITALNTKEEMLSFVRARFPQFGELMTVDEAEALLARPVARVATVRCQRFHEGSNILLIGDAVHAVSAAIGQGCNAALQDVWVFNQILDRYQDDWDQALPEFSDQRTPEDHALRELSDYSFPRNRWLVAEFIWRLQISRIFHRWFPKQVPPFLFDLVFDSNRPYSEVLKLHQSWIDKVKRAS